MTVNEIAEAVGKTNRAVRKWVVKAAEKHSSMEEKNSASTSTYPADYTLEETLMIIEAGMGRNASDVFRVNAENYKIPVNSHNEFKSVLKEFIPLVQTMIQENNKQLITLLKTDHNFQPRLEYKQDYFGIIAYANLHGITDMTVSEARRLSVEARKLSMAQGKEVRTVPDERWGKANSYHVDVLKEVFKI